MNLLPGSASSEGLPVLRGTIAPPDLALVIPAGDPLGIATLEGLDRPDVRVVLASASEPGARQQYISALEALLGQPRTRPEVRTPIGHRGEGGRVDDEQRWRGERVGAEAAGVHRARPPTGRVQAGDHGRRVDVAGPADRQHLAGSDLGQGPLVLVRGDRLATGEPEDELRHRHRHQDEDPQVTGPAPEAVRLRLPLRAEAIPVIEIAEGSLASSSGREHIRPHCGRMVGPHVHGISGESVVDRFVSVTAQECIVADALTKVVMAIGSDAAPILRRYGANAYVYEQDTGWTTIGD